MDNHEKKNSPKENDIDLGSVFSAIGRGFRSIGQGISSGGTALGTGLLNIIIFFKKRFIWIALAIAAGIGWGLYSGSDMEARYESEMTARFNFGSTVALYSSIDYLNALISGRNTAELSRLLGISAEEAGALGHFDAEPIKDELTISELYRRNFMMFDRSYRIRTDTFWTRIIPYDKFKSSLTKFDIPLQQIKASGIRSDIFQKIQPGFLNLILSNENLKRNLSISGQIQTEEESIIVSSIRGLDTLRDVYNHRLRQFPSTGGATTNINVADQPSGRQNPELEVYDKMLGLKDELRSLRNYTMNNSQVIQVYAPFNPVGKKLDVFRKNLLITTLSAFVLVLVILVAIEAFKAISAYERRLKNAPGR